MEFGGRRPNQEIREEIPKNNSLCERHRHNYYGSLSFDPQLHNGVNTQ